MAFSGFGSGDPGAVVASVNSGGASVESGGGSVDANFGLLPRRVIGGRLSDKSLSLFFSGVPFGSLLTPLTLLTLLILLMLLALLSI